MFFQAFRLQAISPSAPAAPSCGSNRNIAWSSSCAGSTPRMSMNSSNEYYAPSIRRVHSCTKPFDRCMNAPLPRAVPRLPRGNAWPVSQYPCASPGTPLSQILRLSVDKIYGCRESVLITYCFIVITLTGTEYARLLDGYIQLDINRGST